MSGSDIRKEVREGYARIAAGEKAACCDPAPAAGCCEPAPAPGCCGSTPTSSCCGEGARDFDSFARSIGYAAEDLEGLPAGANLGLSCGNPTALASLAPGEVVLDLGSGAGFDVFIAGRKVGEAGRVIGVDMTPEMVMKARENAERIGARNVEFRLGEIENLPVADASVDVVISNCVVNLSPEKPRVFREIARVLKPGGRVAISDIALLRPLPEEVRADVEAYIGCIAGAVLVDEYERYARDAGLTDLAIERRGDIDAKDEFQDPTYRRILAKLPAGTGPGDYLASVSVTARKR
jgi:SAM-dependent methyltransferase